MAFLVQDEQNNSVRLINFCTLTMSTINRPPPPLSNLFQVMLTLINMLLLFLVVGGAHGSHCGCVDQH